MTIKEILHRLWVRAVESGYLNGTEADRERSKALDDLLSLIQLGVEERIIGESFDVPRDILFVLQVEKLAINANLDKQRAALHQWIKELRGTE